MTARLVSLDSLPPSVQRPVYARDGLGCGIVHLGLGAFHKAHQAVYTDDAIAEAGGDWMTVGVSLRSPDVADALNPQDGLYTLLVRGAGGTSARVIGSVRRVLVAPREPEAVLGAIAAPEARIVSLTITEKGYGLDPATGGLDRGNPAIAADLEGSAPPRSAVGLLVEAMRRRMTAGLAGVTVLCCDNLPGNGRIVRRLVGEFAAAKDQRLADWIAEKVRFPATMVDRITPASTAETLDEVRRLTGHADEAAVETESFSQWIIEDDFVAGRPAWEAGGALFVRDVAAYEKMKLRMLNGAHSMLAYAGHLAGHAFVRDVMGDTDLALLVERHMQDAARTLDPVPGIDLARYASELRDRFTNPAIAHRTYQIAMDGTQKLPQRLLEPAASALERGWPLDAYAFAVAAWMRYATGRDERGKSYALRDPREAEIAAVVERSGDEPALLADGLLNLPGLFPQGLRLSQPWRDKVSSKLACMLEQGMRAAIEREVSLCRA
ncbi:mannitol dehydrogenase family protein [Nitratireductor mangrovi]|uniref:Mannitol dehydrogenase family protein n=1 Tax=Nitratireductor mangrovi TaxID=2599600 RepID=A0A5B8L0L7_9HYPH|nr:mannitol dehydrogenase family protein [Nitratireductor mangrovi]QDZ01441.1 mannitol dehydrogenase family protein [Nitratireductor mangrovi]